MSDNAIAHPIYELVYFFGRNFTLTYIDKDGEKQSKRIRTDKDDHLVKLLSEIPLEKHE